MHKHTHTQTYVCTHTYKAYDNGQSHFQAKLSICLVKSNSARQIFYTLSMEILWSLQMKMNVRKIFSPYHKHCAYTHTYSYQVQVAV